MTTSSRPGARTGRIEVTVRADDGTELEAVASGHGPDVVAVHGMGTDVRHLRPILDELAPGHRGIAYSRRGHGRSGDSGHHSLRLEAGDVAAVHRALGGAEPVLLGHSYGGLVALAAAAQGTGRAVVAYEPAFLGEPAQRDAAAAARRLAADGREREAVRLAMTEVFAAPAALVAGVTLMPAEWCARFARRMARELIEVERTSPRAFAGLGVPVVVVVGQQSTDAVARSCAELAAAVADSELVVLDGVGHDGIVERAGVLAEVVAAAARG